MKVVILHSNAALHAILVFLSYPSDYREDPDQWQRLRGGPFDYFQPVHQPSTNSHAEVNYNILELHQRHMESNQKPPIHATLFSKNQTPVIG